MSSCFSIAGFEEALQIPLSSLSGRASLDYDDLVRMRDPGEDIFTATLDAVTPEIFDRASGGVDSLHQWDMYWHARLGREFYGRRQFGAPHWRRGGSATWAAIIIMFAFFPERSALMEDGEPVCRDQWRRVQLAGFLIEIVSDFRLPWT